MTVNPDEREKKIEKLWSKAKKLEPSITRKEFNKAVESFIAQHQTLPEKIQKIKIPGVDESKVKIVTKVGEIPNIIYTTKSIPESRKSYTDWIHETKGLSLVSDSEGNLYLYGKTKLRSDGWLVD